MSGIEVRILKVECRSCGKRLNVELPSGDAMSFAQLLREVVRQVEAEGHICFTAKLEARE